MCNTRNFYVSTRLFLCAQDMFNLGFCVSVYSLNNWTRIDCVGFIWGRYIDTWRFIFSLGVENTYQLPCWGHWSLLSSVLNRSGASVIVVAWTILSTNGVSMLFSHKFFGLPNVSPPPFCTLHWWYPSFWTCLFFSQKFNILYSCGAL